MEPRVGESTPERRERGYHVRISRADTPLRARWRRQRAPLSSTTRRTSSGELAASLASSDAPVGIVVSIVSSIRPVISGTASASPSNTRNCSPRYSCGRLLPLWLPARRRLLAHQAIVATASPAAIVLIKGCSAAFE